MKNPVNVTVNLYPQGRNVSRKNTTHRWRSHIFRADVADPSTDFNSANTITGFPVVNMSAVLSQLI